MFSTFKKIVRGVVPSSLLDPFLVVYHQVLAIGATLIYGAPARGLFVIGVTGTKGKSSVVEMVNAILEEAGYTTTVVSTIRFKVGKESRPNPFKMTMPGRGFIQSILSKARKNKCTHAIVEVTSEGARQGRHVGLFFDALVFTNIAREHIESHGSFENYKAAKLAIGNALLKSSKRPRTVVANPEDELGARFLKLPVEKVVPFSLPDAHPYTLSDSEISFTLDGSTITAPFPGEFTILNALAAAKLTNALGIETPVIARALRGLKKIPGRVEKIERGQDFLAIVDYAHTPDSLKALYSAFPERKKLCVLGNTGGGRDSWKRPEMGRIADEECMSVILTNEDPYDENPDEIVTAMARGMKRSPRIIMDRREAIRTALLEAKSGDAVLVTGKGTDPYIMGRAGEKMPWSDAVVVSEELAKLGYKKTFETSGQG